MCLILNSCLLVFGGVVELAKEFATPHFPSSFPSSICLVSVIEKVGTWRMLRWAVKNSNCLRS